MAALSNSEVPSLLLKKQILLILMNYLMLLVSCTTCVDEHHYLIRITVLYAVLSEIFSELSTFLRGTDGPSLSGTPWVPPIDKR